MLERSARIKEKMLEFTQLFTIERNVFQRFVIVYRYIRYLKSDPVTKSILQKIFDDTASIIGSHSEEYMNEDQFLDVKGAAIFSREFWIYYSNLELIYARMKKLKHCDIDDKAEFNKLSNLFSKPYSKEMLNLSFKVVNSEVFNELDRKCFMGGEKEDTHFDHKKSILYIKGKKVLINKQEKITNAHKLLYHIFITNKKNTADDFFYSEIASDEFNELDYSSRKNGWRKYHRACEYVNNKINEQTEGEILNFLIYNTGKRGRVKVNKKFL